MLVTTGLRGGGLCRLQWPAAVSPPFTRGCDVPSEVSTVEKGGKHRSVRLTDTCRILIALWYRDNRGGGRLLFPSRADAERPMSTRRLWNLCDAVFRRAGLSGDHVHPHTFRHTVIQMLYLNGMTFENIAKWIGHAHPSVTSNVYGRLAQQDLYMCGVPFASTDDGQADAWRQLARYVHAPFVFPEPEWEGLRRSRTAPPDGGGGGSKRRAIERAERVLAASGTVALEDLIRTAVSDALKGN